MEEANVLEIGQLGDRVACEIIQAWLRKAGRHLTNFQVIFDLRQSASEFLSLIGPTWSWLQYVLLDLKGPFRRSP